MELSHRTITQIGHYRDMNLAGVEPGTLLKLYFQMLRLRRTEEALHHEYHPADEMRCPIHFCIGQEAIPAALSLHVRPDDYLFSHHRSHGYYFAKGSPLRELFATIFFVSVGILLVPDAVVAAQRAAVSRRRISATTSAKFRCNR